VIGDGAVAEHHECEAMADVSQRMTRYLDQGGIFAVTSGALVPEGSIDG
jgi:hypothetical protein